MIWYLIFFWLWCLGWVEEAADEKTWIFQEWFTNSSEPAADYYVNQENLLTSISFKNNDGEEFKINYLSPIPYLIPDLNIEEKKEFESEMQFDSAEFSMPTTLIYERFEDQTITTPAGEFSNCQHYVINTTSLFDIKIAQIPAKEVREIWYHPSVNGVVKEVYRKSPIKYLFWSMEGYTAESELISFSQDAPMTDFTPTQSINDEIQFPVNNSDPQKNNYLLVMVFIIILITVGVYFTLKFIKQKKPHHSQWNRASY